MGDFDALFAEGGHHFQEDSVLGMQRIIFCNIHPKVSIEFNGMIGQAVEDNHWRWFTNKPRHVFNCLQDDLPDEVRLGGMRQVEAEFNPALVGAV